MLLPSLNSARGLLGHFVFGTTKSASSLPNQTSALVFLWSPSTAGSGGKRVRVGSAGQAYLMGVNLEEDLWTGTETSISTRE